MPYTKKQQRVAQAVEHGWKPKGSAKGFSKEFAEDVVNYDAEAEARKRRSRQGRASFMGGAGTKIAPK